MPASTQLKIDYIEFASPELEATQAFFSDALGWEFESYGPDYRDIQNAGIGGGLERAPLSPPLIVLKSDDLESAQQIIEASGGRITQAIFEFPGGKRFEFVEPGGTAMAVWCPLT